MSDTNHANPVNRARHWARYIVGALLGWLFYAALFFGAGRLVRLIVATVERYPISTVTTEAPRPELHHMVLAITSAQACALAAACAVLVVLYLRWPMDNPEIDHQIDHDIDANRSQS